MTQLTVARNIAIPALFFLQVFICNFVYGREKFLDEFQIKPFANNIHFSANRESKFFGIGLVRFQNSGCTSLGSLDGTCYTRRQCSNISGIVSGSCASGIGVCCVVFRSCGDTSTYNSTYFLNSDYPTAVTDSERCTMTIEKCNSGICQVRIDFLSLTLAQPNATGYCVTDALYIIGGAGPVPAICGENTGQHVYVDFNDNDPIQMIITTSASTLGRIWNFEVTQIACDCPTRAPTGCLMFYNTTSGTVNSFNYGTGTNVIDPATGVPGTRELVNENYGVCINMLAGYCGIEWSSTSFMVSGNANGVGIGALTDGDCNSDFVVIADPYYENGTAVNSDRFCGLAFDTVISYSKPFVLYVVTNGDEVNDTMNIGFSLTFTQVACTSSLALG